jgi:hypothetical protein
VFRQEAIDYQKTKWKGKALLLPGTPLWLTAIFSVSITTFIIFLSLWVPTPAG